MSRRLLVVMILLLPALSGCVKRFHLSKEQAARPSAWPMYRFDAGATGADTTAGFTGRLDTIWSRRGGDRPTGPLTIQHGLLAVTSTRKRIKFYDLMSGEYKGQIRFPAPPQTALVVQDTIGFLSVAPPKNTLFAIKLTNLKTVWKVPVKDAPPGSILVSNRLIIGSADGTLLALDPKDGKVLWKFQTHERFSAAPSYEDGKLFQPSEKGRIHVLSATDGKELYQVSVKGPIVSAATVAGDLYAGDVLGNLYCIDQQDGAIRWQVPVGGPIWTTPTIAGNLVIVGHSGGDLIAYDQRTGQQVWKYSPVEVIKASPIVVGTYVVAGTLRGSLFTLRLSDGSLVSRGQLSSPVVASPVSDGRNIYVVTQDGRILCLGERYEQPRESSH